PAAQGVDRVALGRRRRRGTALKIQLAHGRIVGMAPELLAAHGVEGEDGVPVVRVAEREQATLAQRHGGEAGADGGLPGARRSLLGPALEPALLVRDAVVAGAAPVRPVAGEGDGRAQENDQAARHGSHRPLPPTLPGPPDDANTPAGQRVVPPSRRRTILVAG